ncbi:hypothetical protein KIPB_011034 [Kipferlia bialata]|uniref:FHA domain-containing protein n=1 Tax=Kipferlia bialata TaxID=797122 RepID=A0A9K3D7M3_9EUKA|nr:hypothetical protein KIPB_011034 [Kipferlia bialata]|eukprot:g11034.t1
MPLSPSVYELSGVLYNQGGKEGGKRILWPKKAKNSLTPKPGMWHLIEITGASGSEDDENISLSHSHCFRAGTDARTNNVILKDPGAEEQHFVIQFYAKGGYEDIEVTQTLGEFTVAGVREGVAPVQRAVPYLVDLDTQTGTLLNHKLIQGATPIELRDRDVITIGAPKADEDRFMGDGVKRERERVKAEAESAREYILMKNPEINY